MSDQKTYEFDKPLISFCTHCKAEHRILVDENKIVHCANCGKPANEFRKANTLDESRVHIEGHIDRIINDIEIIKQEIIFSKNFDFEMSLEVPTLTLMRDNFKVLKNKVSKYSVKVKKY